jgi:prepilin-type processing-associated H-X9-DG protein
MYSSDNNEAICPAAPIPSTTAWWVERLRTNGYLSTSKDALHCPAAVAVKGFVVVTDSNIAPNRGLAVVPTITQWESTSYPATQRYFHNVKVPSSAILVGEAQYNSNNQPSRGGSIDAKYMGSGPNWRPWPFHPHMAEAVAHLGAANLTMVDGHVEQWKEMPPNKYFSINFE